MCLSAGRRRNLCRRRKKGIRARFKKMKWSKREEQKCSLLEWDF